MLSVINSGPNNYYGIDRIPVCTGSVLCMYANDEFMLSDFNQSKHNSGHFYYNIVY